MEDNRLIVLLILAVILAAIRALGEARQRWVEEKRERDADFRRERAEQVARAAESAQDIQERKQLDEEMDAWKRNSDSHAAQDKARALRDRLKKIEEYDWKD